MSGTVIYLSMGKNQNEKKGNNSYNFFIAFQMGASWPCILPATFYTVFGSAFCPLRIVASQPCRPESFGLLPTTKHRRKYISCLLKLANTKTNNNLLGWWDFAQQNLLRHHKKSNVFDFSLLLRSVKILCSAVTYWNVFVRHLLSLHTYFNIYDKCWILWKTRAEKCKVSD